VIFLERLGCGVCCSISRIRREGRVGTKFLFLFFISLASFPKHISGRCDSDFLTFTLCWVLGDTPA